MSIPENEISIDLISNNGEVLLIQDGQVVLSEDDSFIQSNLAENAVVAEGDKPIRFDELQHYQVKVIRSFEDAIYRDLWVFSSYLLGFGLIFRDIPFVYNAYASIAKQLGMSQDPLRIASYFYKPNQNA